MVENLCKLTYSKWGKQMLEAVNITNKTNKETAFALCDNTIEPICIGNECSVNIKYKKCSDGSNTIGSFHTHPNLNQKMIDSYRREEASDMEPLSEWLQFIFQDKKFTEMYNELNARINGGDEYLDIGKNISCVGTEKYLTCIIPPREVHHFLYSNDIPYKSFIRNPSKSRFRTAEIENEIRLSQRSGCRIEWKDL